MDMLLTKSLCLGALHYAEALARFDKHPIDQYDFRTESES